MKFLDAWDRYYKYKAVKEIDRAIQEHLKEKKRIIRFYGKNYYKKEKYWLKIKDQRWYETREVWAMRLKVCGFTTDGVEIKTGEKHNTPPFLRTDK